MAQWKPIWNTIVQLAESAQASGELDAGILMAMVIASLLMRTVVEREAIDKQMVSSMIDIVTRMQFPR